MAIFSPESIVQAAVGRQMSTNLAGEFVILDIQQGLYYGLDAVGADVWQMLQTPASVSAIVQAIVQRYDVDLDAAFLDIDALLNELLALGLIERCASPAA